VSLQVCPQKVIISRRIQALEVVKAMSLPHYKPCTTELPPCQ
jgi:hypothetical protein